MTLMAGFADPVAHSQACFRAVLAAMAQPGTLRDAATPGPDPLDPATAAVLLTLLDPETPCWLADACAPARPWVAFHCGAPSVGVAEAAFAVALEMPALASLSNGSDETPETGATLILQVAGFGRGRAMRLSGPGLATPARLQVAGLPDDFVAQWRDNHSRFPRGVDMILCAGAQVTALPRSLTIEAV